MEKILHIGGLVAAGFDSCGEYLLTVSHSGRAVYLRETWEKVFRSTEVVYPENGIIPGIGPLEGKQIWLSELDYSTGRLEFSSPDGQLLLSYEEGVLSVSQL